MLVRMRVLWLLILTTLVAGCLPFGGARKPSPAPAPDAAGIKAEAVIEGTGIRFFLRGYRGTEFPTLQVTSLDGLDWTTKVNKPERKGDDVTAKLEGFRGTARLAVEQFSYTWTTPSGKEFSGELQFRDSRYLDMAWQVTSSDRVLIYHVGPLPKDALQDWEETLAQAEEWTGQQRAKRLVVWIFPDVQTLNDWARSGSAFRAAGQWWSDVERMVLYDQGQSRDRLVVMLHETVHALTPEKGGPDWFDEGIAEILGIRLERKLAGGRASSRWTGAAYSLQALQAEASKRAISPWETDREKRVVDPYTIGVSFWLFIRHELGEEVWPEFLVEGTKPNGVLHFVEAKFGKSYADVVADWNAYLRSPDLLVDWEMP